MEEEKTALIYLCTATLLSGMHNTTELRREMEDTRQNKKQLTKKVIVAEKEAERGFLEEEWRDWSSLTKDLLLSIVSFLVTLSDFSSFSAVCRSWRFSSCVVSRLTMSSQSPLFLLCRRGSQTKAIFDATHHCIYKSPLLPWGIRTCRIFGYTHGHLVAAPRKHDRPILLVNFFTGTKTKLPPTPMPTPTDDEFVPEHFLLSSSPGCIAILLGTSKCFFYCRLGDPHWTRYQLPPPHSVEDVVFVGNRLYALTTDGRLGFFSFVPHPVFTVLKDNSINVEEANSRWCLAESAGDLLAIRCTWASCVILIWHWDLEGGCGFVEVSSLGERALFFANGRFAGSLTASVRSGVTGNSIYRINSWECRVYSVETKRMIYCITKFPEYYRYPPIPVLILPSLC